MERSTKVGSACENCLGSKYYLNKKECNLIKSVTLNSILKHQFDSRYNVIFMPLFENLTVSLLSIF